MPVDNENLISAIFIRAPLWDKKNKNYHNRYVIDKNWDEISKELNKEKEVLKKKWKQLRDTFRAELKKNRFEQSGSSGPDCESNCTWPYFKSMLFLKDQMKCRPSSGNLKKQTVAEKTDLIEKEELSDKEQDKEKNTFEVGIEYSPRNLYRKRKLNATEKKLELLEKKRKEQSTHEKDEDMAFFESLLPHVRSMDPPKKLLCRMEILNIVYNHAYKSTSYNSNPWRGIPETTTSSISQYTIPEFSPVSEYEDASSPECPNSCVTVSDAAELQS